MYLCDSFDLQLLHYAKVFPFGDSVGKCALHINLVLKKKKHHLFINFWIKIHEPTLTKQNHAFPFKISEIR